ncbi:MAG TPA: ABC transporter substrate-binding protein [Actinomycetota bacterium]|nr:ABC transporter substrate-binding protein [Actinomycetota bacterium]
MSFVIARSVPSIAVVGVLIAAMVAACSGGGASPSASAGAPSAAAPSSSGAAASGGPKTHLTVGLGYIPSVQFAQFYLAQQAGYYAEAGLDVEFQNKIDPDLITLVGSGAIDLGIGDGTSVMPAVSNGIPIKYIATIYGQFPNILFAKASSGIASAADLKGRKIGTPGRYGSGWIFLQALLGTANLTVGDVQIVEYPDFTQRAAVDQGAVDAATGFSNNEPVQMELAGTKATVLHIDDAVPLPGPGLIAGTKTLEDKHDAVAGFVAATLRAMNEIKANPSVGLDAAIKAVPELASDRTGQAAVLAATIDSWIGPLQQTRGLGAIDSEGWKTSIGFMEKLKLLAKPVTTEELVDSTLLPAGD